MDYKLDPSRQEPRPYLTVLGQVDPIVFSPAENGQGEMGLSQVFITSLLEESVLEIGEGEKEENEDDRICPVDCHADSHGEDQAYYETNKDV